MSMACCLQAVPIAVWRISWRLADEYNGRIKVLKVDVDKNQALAAAARIQSIPTLFFITKEGDIERVVGGLPYQELVRMAEKISSSEE